MKPTTLHEKHPNAKLFLVRIFLYSDQNNSVFGHFSPIVRQSKNTMHSEMYSNMNKMIKHKIKQHKMDIK